MKINYDGQLLTTSITLSYRGKRLQISDIVIDTGSSHTIFSPDILEQIGVTYENGDAVYEAYGIGGSVSFYTKVMEFIQIDNILIEHAEVDIGLLPKTHKGLLGLDILLSQGFIIDMDKLELYSSQKSS
jgi:hypothetical protein